jgi:hypothetical protein
VIFLSDSRIQSPKEKEVEMLYWIASLVRSDSGAYGKTSTLDRILLREVIYPLGFIIAVLVTNYGLAFVPNVKFFDLIVFLAGFSMGVRRGSTVAIISWAVYGNFNPWGQTTGPLLAVVMGAELLYALAGAWTRQILAFIKHRYHPVLLGALFGTAAFIPTFLYDLTTNVYTGLVWSGFAGNTGTIDWIWVALVNPGAILFYILHIGSNVTFFVVLGIPIARRIQKRKFEFPWQG